MASEIDPLSDFTIANHRLLLRVLLRHKPSCGLRRNPPDKQRPKTANLADKFRIEDQLTFMFAV